MRQQGSRIIGTIRIVEQHACAGFYGYTDRKPTAEELRGIAKAQKLKELGGRVEQAGGFVMELRAREKDGRTSTFSTAAMSVCRDQPGRQPATYCGR
jgi:hypothetical protein